MTKRKVIELRGEDNENQFKHFQKKIRATLKDITVNIEYENIYGDTHKLVDHSLSFFDDENMISKKKKFNRKKERSPFSKPVNWKI